MSTNKIVIRSTDEFMADYKPTYQPIYPMLMGKSVAYAEEVGKLNFKRLEAVSDIRAKHITPKDTEIQQIGARESSKTFKKYFLANQFIQSTLQDSRQNEDVIAQVLDEHQLQMDELALLGEGTSNNDVINNGLFYSGDSNYTTESSYEIPSAGDNLIAMHDKILENAYKADQIAGRKLLIAYGANVIAKFDSLFSASSKSFKSSLMESLGANYSMAKMPKKVTPANVNGWIIVNLDQLKFHYTALPTLRSQGVNDEKMYTWHNFVMGSCMVEVLAKDGIVHQPVTFAA